MFNYVTALISLVHYDLMFLKYLVSEPSVFESLIAETP